MATETNKRYSVRTSDGSIILGTDDISLARRLIERLRGPIYLQYEERAIRDFAQTRIVR